MSEKEIIEILKDVICDEVIGTYCVEIQKEGVNCSENCKDDDCYLIKAVEGIIDLYTKEKEKNKEYEKQLDLDYVDKNYISKEKIREKIRMYKAIDNAVGVRVLELLLEDTDERNNEV